MAIWDSKFRNLVIGTNAADEGVDREELDALLVSGVDSIGVVMVGSNIA